MASVIAGAGLEELVLFRLEHTYAETLENFGLTASRYCARIARLISRLKYGEKLGRSMEKAVMAATRRYKVPDWVDGLGLEHPDSWVHRFADIMFRMEPEYLKTVYARIQESPLPPGYNHSLHNREPMIVIGLEESVPGLRLGPRNEVVRQLYAYVIRSEGGVKGAFRRMGITRAMGDSVVSKIMLSEEDVFKIYDMHLQRNRRYETLFDLEQQEHIHPWDVATAHFQEPSVAMQAALHAFEERIPALRLASRSEEVMLINRHIINAGCGLEVALCSMGLEYLLLHGLNGRLKDFPIGVVVLYDEARKRRDSRTPICSPVAEPRIEMPAGFDYAKFLGRFVMNYFDLIADTH